MSTASAKLRAIGIGVEFAGLRALSDVDLALEPGEILGLVGPNGAGKTTLVNVLSGFQRPTTGRVVLGEHDVTGMRPHRLAVRGLGRTFQSVRLFARLTVFENVLAGAVAGGLRTAAARTLSYELLEQTGLSHLAAAPGGSLPHGEERRVGIVRALAARPRFLLLDEPAAGLNEIESAGLRETLASIPDRYGLGMLVIEHDMPLILGLSQRIHVLDHGRTIAEGTPQEVREDPRVIEAYLGAGAAAEASG